MLSSKLLGSSRALISRNAFQVRNSGESLRKGHTVAVPPRVKLSTAEKAIYGLLLVVSMTCVPVWVLYHIPDYQKENRNEYTGR